MAFYKKRIVVQDKPSDIAERIYYRAAKVEAYSDTIAKFHVITTDNFEESDAFQTRRIEQIMRNFK